MQLSEVGFLLAFFLPPTAVLLGLNRDQIRYRIEKFKLEKPAAI